MNELKLHDKVSGLLKCNLSSTFFRLLKNCYFSASEILVNKELTDKRKKLCDICEINLSFRSASKGHFKCIDPEECGKFNKILNLIAHIIAKNPMLIEEKKHENIAIAIRRFNKFKNMGFHIINKILEDTNFNVIIHSGENNFIKFRNIDTKEVTSIPVKYGDIFVQVGDSRDKFELGINSLQSELILLSWGWIKNENVVKLIRPPEFKNDRMLKFKKRIEYIFKRKLELNKKSQKKQLQKPQEYSYWSSSVPHISTLHKHYSDKSHSFFEENFPIPQNIRKIAIQHSVKNKNTFIPGSPNNECPEVTPLAPPPPLIMLTRSITDELNDICPEIIHDEICSNIETLKTSGYIFIGIISDFSENYLELYKKIITFMSMKKKYCFVLPKQYLDKEYLKNLQTYIQKFDFINQFQIIFINYDQYQCCDIYISIGGNFNEDKLLESIIESNRYHDLISIHCSGGASARVNQYVSLKFDDFSRDVLNYSKIHNKIHQKYIANTVAGFIYNY